MNPFHKSKEQQDSKIRDLGVPQTREITALLRGGDGGTTDSSDGGGDGGLVNLPGGGG